MCQLCKFDQNQVWELIHEGWKINFDRLTYRTQIRHWSWIAPEGPMTVVSGTERAWRIMKRLKDEDPGEFRHELKEKLKWLLT